MTTFIRLLEITDDEKPAALLRLVREVAVPEGADSPRDTLVFDLHPDVFAEVPGSPFAYWVSDRVRRLFIDQPPFESGGRIARAGLQTSDDFRFARAWWEVRSNKLLGHWRPFAKGGAFSRFYSAINLVVNWFDDGREAKAFAEKTPGSNHWSRNLRNAEHYLRPGLTWIRRSHSLCVSVLPAQALFSDGAQAIFAEKSELGSVCAAVNSRPFDALLKFSVGRTGSGVQFMPGMISATPMPLEMATDAKLAWAFLRGWSLRRTLFSTNETSHAFLLPLGPNEKVTQLDRTSIEQELTKIQCEIDDRAFVLYAIGTEDRTAIEAATKAGPAVDVSAADEKDEDSGDGVDDEVPLAAPADTLLSWFVGVAFGRFDERLATGKRLLPTEPEPFDPLPARSPGMWPEEDARTLVPPAVLVDDIGHNDDIHAHVANAMAHTGWPDPTDLRPWLTREFFQLHIKMYSKSRRKAPIYWQLATPSASYSVWLYIHAFTKDTLYKVQNDYVAPKLLHEERRLESLRRELGESPKAAERKALTAQETFVEELRAFLEEVKRVAPLWNPDLDDGVIINFAPLWRLVPHHKPWQKELKATWDALCSSEYDWAHLAMHLWPERVVPKCVTDRSLAIAHGLEDVFWIEGSDGKWRARPKPTRSIDEIVRERTSPAVKAALTSLENAPAAASGVARTRARRRTSGAPAEGGR